MENTKMHFEMMSRALPYAAELLDCEEIKEFKRTVREAESMTSGQMMAILLPVMLGTKQDTVFGLLGAISGKKAEEIAAQDWEETRALMQSPVINDLSDFYVCGTHGEKCVTLCLYKYRPDNLRGLLMLMAAEKEHDARAAYFGNALCAIVRCASLGKSSFPSWDDVFRPDERKNDSRTAAEIKADVLRRLKGA